MNRSKNMRGVQVAAANWVAYFSKKYYSFSKARNNESN